MSATKLVIKNYSNNCLKDGSCIIFLRYTYKGAVTYFSTKESIDPKHWNVKEGMVKKTYKGYLHLNEYLQSFKVKVDNIIRKCRLSDDEDDEPTVAHVKSLFNKVSEKRKQNLKPKTTFFEFVEQFIKEAEGHRRFHTIKSYKLAKNNLIKYQKSRNIQLDWDSFNLEFYADFQKFFNEERLLSNNTFGTAVRNLKAFLNEAYERKINKYDFFKSKKFVSVHTPSDNIYLNENEIQILADIDLSKNKKLDRVRDLFVFACCCGLRYTDFSTLSPDNFIGDRIRITTSKTGTDVEIPLHPLIVTIRTKYEDGVPLPMTNQKMNAYLKELGKLAGFNRQITVRTYRGSDVIKETKQAWEIISTHTARRSFATNLFKQGFPAISIMLITGHKTEKAFLKYIKVGLEENAQMLEKHWKKVYENKLSAA